MSPPVAVRSTPIPVKPAELYSDPKYQEMDLEISALIRKTPDTKSYPSRELIVANAYIEKHPEYEKSRTEVYVSYVRVYEKLRKEGKLPEQNPDPAPAPVSAPQDGKKQPAVQANPEAKPPAQPADGKHNKKSSHVAELKTTPPASESRQPSNGAFIREIHGDQATMLFRSYESFRKVPSPADLKRMMEEVKKIEANQKKGNAKGDSQPHQPTLPKTEQDSTLTDK